MSMHCLDRVPEASETRGYFEKPGTPPFEQDHVENNGIQTMKHESRNSKWPSCHGMTLFLIGVAGLAGCATMGIGQHYRVTPVAEDDVILEMSQQGPMLLSTKANMAISVRPISSLWASDERPGFHLFVANLSDYGFSFGMDNIRAVYNGQTLRVVPPEVLVVEARQRQQAAANNAATLSFLTQLSGHLSTQGASADYDSYIRAQQQAELGAMAVQEAVHEEAVTSQEAAFAEEDYRRHMLKEQLIPPTGQGEGRNVGGGVIFVDIPSSIGGNGYFEILIDVGGEYHDFRFEAQRVDA